MSDTRLEADVTVNAIGSSCPGPMMDLVGKAKDVDPGTVIRLQSSNEETEPDVSEWASESGNELVDVVDRGDHWDLYVRIDD
ncbi:sulfurtransferase TusA family protein [Halobellus limi]|jgi:TusA-related sulfurtransferase|uniref:Sulfurtransferase TusA family protein n=1 Tax=Halobellus limi TaxID=699433 RepID=A0A1H6BG10_9EURY|nr:sulfurtransferase TusA family protein [Halobellus limi]QCC49006.1 sulfurtransferase TusA family protein [Halobellus limi]SEG59265.1 TusA-related sulfurtransferase [Halobellus limi]